MDTYIRVTTQNALNKYGIKTFINKSPNILIFCKITTPQFLVKIYQVDIKSDSTISNLYKVIQSYIVKLKNKDKTLSINKSFLTQNLTVLLQVLNELNEKIGIIKTYNFNYSELRESNIRKIKLKITNLQNYINLKNTTPNINNTTLLLPILEYIVFAYNKIKHILMIDYEICLIFKKCEYIYNFKSSLKNQCKLLEYHSSSYGKDCQFIGFFGKDASITTFNHFITDKIDPIYVFYTNAVSTIINDEVSYNLDYNKTEQHKFMKLNYAEEKVITIYEDGTQSSEIKKHSSLIDEYVLISNIDTAFYTIKIKNNTHIKIFHDDHINITDASIMLDYLKLINNATTIYFNVSIFTLDQLHVKFQQVAVRLDGVYEKKYLKYKTKYLELKFKDIKL